MFQLKKLNPYIQHQWKKDREKVVVFSERIEEIQLLRSQIASMPAPEQEQWVSELESMLKKETSPEIRRESIQVLEVVHHRPDAIAAIAPYSKDKNEKVRLAVVDALRKSDSEVATNTLLALAASDPSHNVKLSATRALGKHNSSEVRSYLANKLDDRNIAIRYQASQALQEMTGKRYGGDIDAWRKYLAGEEVPEPKASLAEAFQSMFQVR